MTKELFIKIMNNIEKEKKRRDKISSVLEEDIIDGWAVFKETYADKNVKLLLEDIFTKEGFEIIEWWLFEDVEKVITYKEDNKEINVEDVSDLYDFLDENYLKKESD